MSQTEVFKPLDKAAAKAAQSHCTPPVNLVWLQNTTQQEGFRFAERMQVLSWDFHGWYRQYGFRAGSDLPAKKAALSDWLGSKPTFHANYEFRNAVWGLSYQDKPFLLYLSAQGISLEVDAKAFSHEDVIEVMTRFVQGLADHAKTYTQDQARDRGPNSTGGPGQ